MARNAVLALICLASGAGGQAIPGSVESLADFFGLPAAPAPGTVMRRWTASDEGVARTDDGWTLAEAAGPGVIVRIAAARAEGRILVFIDGDEKASVDLEAAKLFSGTAPGFPAPLAGRAGGGFESLVPIGFRERFRIVLAGVDDPRASGVEVAARIHPGGSAVKRWAAPRNADDREALERVLGVWRNPGRCPTPGSRNDTVGSTRPALKPGETRSILEAAGPGTILAVRIVPQYLSPAILRGLLVEMFWDGATEPSVSVPLADLCGNSFGDGGPRGLALGFDERGGYLHFAMPFRQSARVTVTNRTEDTVNLLGAVQWRAGDPVPDALAFHAEMRAVDGSATGSREIVAAEGPGKLVGFLAAGQGLEERAFREDRLVLQGAGGGAAWFDVEAGRLFDPGPDPHPAAPSAAAASGVLLRQDAAPWRSAAWRTFIGDAVPFPEKLTAAWGVRSVRETEIRTVVLWYGPVRPVRRPGAGLTRDTRAWVVRPEGWTGAAGLKWAATPPVALERWDDFSPGHRSVDRPVVRTAEGVSLGSGGEAVDPRAALFTATAEGRTYRATLPVEAAGPHALHLRLVGGPGGPDVRIRVAGREVGTIATKAGLIRPLDVQIFDAGELAAGDAVLEFEVPAVTAPARIGCDAVLLLRTGAASGK